MLRSFARTAHSTHSLRNAQLCYARSIHGLAHSTNSLGWSSRECFHAVNASHRSISLRSALECHKHALLVGRHIAKRISSKGWSKRKLWFFFIFDLFIFPLPARGFPRFYSPMYDDFLGVRSFDQVSSDRICIRIWQNREYWWLLATRRRSLSVGHSICPSFCHKIIIKAYFYIFCY